MIENFDKTVAVAKEMLREYPPIETLTVKKVYFLGNEKYTLISRDSAKESEINRLSYFIDNINKYDDNKVNIRIKEGVAAGIKGIEFAKIIYERFIQSIELIDVKSAAYYLRELNDAIEVIEHILDCKEVF